MGDGMEGVGQGIPAADILEPEVNDGREPSTIHEELEHLGIDGRGQPAFST